MNRLSQPKLRGLLILAAISLLLLALTGCGLEEYFGVFVSMTTPGMTEDGVEYSTEDILVAFDDGDTNWLMAFDGSEYGLTPKHNISAFSFNELMWANLYLTSFPTDDLELVPDLYLSFAPNAIFVPGITPKVAGQDIVRFTDLAPAEEGTPFELFFDGSDVGLTLNSEKIDGLGVWPPEYFDFWGIDVEGDLPEICNAGVLFITTMGRYRVPGADGGSIVGTGSDILLFCAFNTGPNTAGLWYRVYNGENAGIRPLHAGFSADVLGFGDFVLSEQSPDLETGIIFAFTSRKPFTHPDLDEPGLPSQLFIAGAEGGGSGIEGPFLDFNAPKVDPEDLPAVNGTVDSIGLFDFSMAPPPP